MPNIFEAGMTTQEPSLEYRAGKLRAVSMIQERVECCNLPSYIPEIRAGRDSPINIPVRKVL
jgi:hypothetical protein